ncbi:MAG: small multi-drug export protein [Spirochaetales bacterium]|nr:small multi-drug export protein [Spirochaetales bacterium]
MFNTYLIASLICFIPLLELRAGIPWAIAYGADPILTFIICGVTNLAVAPLVFLFLFTFHKLFLRWKWYENFSTAILERSRQKLHKNIEKYGYIGIALFVAIPLPLTGAYTGALGAWILGMETKRSIIAIGIGVLIAGIAITIISVGGKEAFSFIYDLVVKPVK